jgi:DNA polymerase-4
LEKAMQTEKQSVRLLGIGVSSIVEPGGQMSMLDTNGQRTAQLNKTIDRIRDKFGFSAIQTGRTLLLRDIVTINGK